MGQQVQVHSPEVHSRRLGLGIQASQPPLYSGPHHWSSSYPCSKLTPLLPLPCPPEGAWLITHLIDLIWTLLYNCLSEFLWPVPVATTPHAEGLMCPWAQSP